MYRSIDAKFWTDPKVRELRPLHKLLFLYLITNSHSHVSGIYYLPKVLMQHETGIPSAEIENGIDTLSRTYLCLYDTTTEVIWVRHMLRYQHHGEKIRLAVASQLESLHNCLIIKEFLEEYQDIDIPYRYPIDTRAPVYKEQEQEQDKEQDKEQEQKITPPSGESRARTREESRRVKEKRRRQSRTVRLACPETYEPSPRQRQFAQEQHIDLSEEIAHFLHHHRKHGDVFVSWEDAFWTWLHNYKKFSANHARASPDELQERIRKHLEAVDREDS